MPDKAGHLADADALGSDEAIPIRPDGYVGAVVTSDDAALLDDYLAGVACRVSLGRDDESRPWRFDHAARCAGSTETGIVPP